MIKCEIVFLFSFRDLIAMKLIWDAPVEQSFLENDVGK